MRITYIHQYFVTPEMPGGTRSYDLASGLVARGHEVTLITSDRSADAGPNRITREAGIEVHWIPVRYDNSMSYRERIASFVRFATRAARLAASIPSDVVFATSTPLTVALPGVFGAWSRRVPFVFEVRDLWPDAPIAVGALRNPLAIAAARRLERFAYRNAREIVALSPGMRDGVIRAGVAPERVTLIPNIAATSRFGSASGDAFRRKLGLGDRPLIVYAGTFGLVNGIGYLVEIAAHLRNLLPSAAVVLLGSGREEAEVRARATELGLLGKELFLLPPVPKAEVPEVLAAADVTIAFVIDKPQLFDNSANKFFDSLAAGRPIAINHGGWLADLLKTEEAGLVLPAREPAEAARQLADALGDRERMARMGANARRLAGRFDETSATLALESVLARAVGTR